MGLLIGLLCICIVLWIAFWLLGLATAVFPPQMRAAIIAVLALCALLWVFGGYSPFYVHHVRW
jgi:hypothetical protein